MPAPAPKNDSILNVVTTILTSRETVPIYWSVACFVAGVVFIKSSLMDNMAPQL
ncbi:hypothetical protein LXG23DRAFT_55014 [Yarrowia lipolytica]|nr:hypothetical protein LXG23DRAFT_55014 [Yarrowia lipolytica]RMI95283.1 hypothetical protein BD777DRAFT_130093 [Yarrowia lipolytica]SEI34101.1 YALIA101S04e10330g1_1 [Yarrowia lipolytica]VBB89004.1 Conserved hypothetical protein [Yarrowia lipolytica]